MAQRNHDETRAIARLPGLDVEIIHRRPWKGGEEQVTIIVQAVPSFEAFGRFLEISNPLLFWTRMMQAAWSPWIIGFTQAPASHRKS